MIGRKPMEEMTLREVMQIKEDLEKELTKKLDEFRATTGLVIKDVYLRDSKGRVGIAVQFSETVGLST